MDIMEKEIDDLITGFKKEETDMYAKIHHKTFEEDILKPLCSEGLTEDIVKRWVFLADGTQLPMIIIDDNGSLVMKTPGLLDNKIAFETTKERELDSSIEVSARSTNPYVKKKVEKDLGAVLKNVKDPRWGEFIEEFESRYGKIELDDTPKQGDIENTGGVQLEDYDI